MYSKTYIKSEAKFNRIRYTTFLSNQNSHLEQSSFSKFKSDTKFSDWPFNSLMLDVLHKKFGKRIQRQLMQIKGSLTLKGNINYFFNNSSRFWQATVLFLSLLSLTNLSQVSC